MVTVTELPKSQLYVVPDVVPVEVLVNVSTDGEQPVSELAVKLAAGCCASAIVDKVSRNRQYRNSFRVKVVSINKDPFKQFYKFKKYNTPVKDFSAEG